MKRVRKAVDTVSRSYAYVAEDFFFHQHSYACRGRRQAVSMSEEETDFLQSRLTGSSVFLTIFINLKFSNHSYFFLTPISHGSQVHKASMLGTVDSVRRFSRKLLTNLNPNEILANGKKTTSTTRIVRIRNFDQL